MSISLTSPNMYYNPTRTIKLVLTVPSLKNGTLSLPLSTITSSTFNTEGSEPMLVSWITNVITQGSPNVGSVSPNTDINTTVLTNVGDKITYEITCIFQSNVKDTFVATATLGSETTTINVPLNPYNIDVPCLHSNNNLITPDGIKNIKDIVVGDSVQDIYGNFVVVEKNFCIPLMRDVDLVEFKANSIGSGIPSQSTSVTHKHLVQPRNRPIEAFRVVNTTSIVRYSENLEMVYQLCVAVPVVSHMVRSNGMLVEAWGTKHFGINFY
jgi:hypothetical protein